MLFDNNSEYSYFNNTFLNNSVDVSSANEGFLKGNMFINEYKPYKNLTYINIKPRSEKEAMLFNVMQYSFAINDLALYLDIHPNNSELINLLNNYIKEEEKAKKEYVSKYGPLDICDNNSSVYEWINSAFPWENEGGIKYV